MLTPEEQKFFDYWSVQRTKKQKSGFNVGFPLGVLIVLAGFISIVTGWHKQAAIVLRSDPSSIIVIVLAGAAIVAFMTVFAGRYQWEQQEQRYKELRAKQAAAGQKEQSTNEGKQ